MRRLITTLLLMTSASSQASAVGANIAMSGPDNLTISVEGECPGRMTLRWEGASPNHSAALAYSNTTGRFVLPGPPCDRTELGLGSNGLQLVRVFQTGPEGRGRLSGPAAPQFCGGYLQVIVIEGNHPCTTSNVVQIPE